MHETTSSISFDKLAELLHIHKDVNIAFGSAQSVKNNYERIGRRLKDEWARRYPDLKYTKVIFTEGSEYLRIIARRPVKNNEEAMDYLQVKLPW